MALSTTGKNTALNAIASAATWFSLHTADPGTTGANEVTGGSPAYARQQGTWSPPSGGVLSMAAAETFDVPTATIAYYGVWSAASGGTFYGGGALSASEVFAAQGTYQLAGATITEAATMAAEMIFNMANSCFGIRAQRAEWPKR